jgi:energy-coupling factor transport system substrate-specific component
MQRALKLLEPAALIAVPVLLALMTVLRAGSAALLSALVLTLALVPFIIRVEISRPRPRDFMPVVVLTALAIVGRLIFEPIPNFQPTSAIIILTGIYFGRQNGFLTGVLTALVSNMFLAQGLWTPWQMYAWGAMGYGAGLLFTPKETVRVRGTYTLTRFEKRVNLYVPLTGFWPIYLYGALSSLAFGIIMDSQYFIGFGNQSGLAGYLTSLAFGLPFNLSHAASSLIFLFATLALWGKKLTRLKTKYNIHPL